MLHFNFFNCHFFFRLYCWNTYSLWQKYCHQLWRTKLMFWNYSSGLWDHHNLTSWSTQGRKNKLGFKAYYHSQEKEIDVWGPGWPNNIKCFTHIFVRWSSSCTRWTYCVFSWQNAGLQTDEEGWTMCLRHWCLAHTFSGWTVYPRCLTFNVKMPPLLSSPSSCNC